MSHIHIPDGVLPWWLWLPGWLATLALVAVAGRLSARADVRRKVPLLGVVSALMLVAMSSEIVPIAYHVNLTVLGGVVLGPALSVPAAFIVVLVLAMLGHGGVTVLGLNTIVIASEMILGWALFRAGCALTRGRARSWVAGVATVLTLAVTTGMLVGIVALAGGRAASARETGALDPASLEFRAPFAEGAFRVGLFAGGEHGEREERPAGLDTARFATVVYTLGPFGWVLEALVTGAIVGYVSRVRPGLLAAGALAEARSTLPGDAQGGH